MKWISFVCLLDSWNICEPDKTCWLRSTAAINQDQVWTSTNFPGTCSILWIIFHSLDHVVPFSWTCFILWNMFHSLENVPFIEYVPFSWACFILWNKFLSLGHVPLSKTWFIFWNLFHCFEFVPHSRTCLNNWIMYLSVENVLYFETCPRVLVTWNVFYSLEHVQLSVTVPCSRNCSDLKKKKLVPFPGTWFIYCQNHVRFPTPCSFLWTMFTSDSVFYFLQIDPGDKQETV